MLVHAGAKVSQKAAELRRTQANDQTGIGAELTAPKVTEPASCAAICSPRTASASGNRNTGLMLDISANTGIGCGRVAAMWLRALPPLERTGEAHRLNRRMLDQPLADAPAVDHVEHAGRHFGALGGTDDRVRHPFGRRHVTAVRLEHHRRALAAKADAVSPPAVENASGKLLAPNTATGPKPMRY